MTVRNHLMTLRNTPTVVGKTHFTPVVIPNARETPPRSWGRRRIKANADGCHRNTPTVVGKTVSITCFLLRGVKHPHGRGEDGKRLAIDSAFVETPPRSWGRHGEAGHINDFLRNTPTVVGKTSRHGTKNYQMGKHPHGRGEDRERPYLALTLLETPPRSWGRLRKMQPGDSVLGNTPTVVGKTILKTYRKIQTGKHPHGRGEDTNTLLKIYS